MTKDGGTGPPSSYDLYGLPKGKVAYPEDEKEEEVTDTKSVRGEIRDFLDYTTTHGIPHIKRVNHWLGKLFWFLSSSGCFGYVVYQITLLAIKYGNNEYDVFIDVVFDRKVDFPAITICNLNPLRQSALIKKVEGDEDLKQLLVGMGWNMDTNVQEMDGGGGGMSGYPSSGDPASGDPASSDPASRDPASGDSTSGDPSSAPSSGDPASTAPSSSDPASTAPASSDPASTAPSTAPSSSDPPPSGTSSGAPPPSNSPPPPPGKRRKRIVEPLEPPRKKRQMQDDQQADDGPSPVYADWQTVDPKREAEMKLLEAVQEWPVPMKEHVGHHIDVMIISCTLAGMECSADNFTQLYNYQYGNCYTFNSLMNDSSMGYTSRPGPYDGLELKLFVELNEYVPQIRESLGFRVVVHDQNQVPFPEDQGFNISPGYHSMLGLRKFVVERLGGDYFPCWPADTEGEQNVYSHMVPDSYSYQVCLRSCYQSSVINNCDCGDMIYPMDNPVFPANISICRTNQEVLCKKEIWDSYLSGSLQCNCTQACRDVQFFGTLSSSIWPLEDSAYQASMVKDFIDNGAHPSLKTVFNKGKDMEERISLLKYNIAKLTIYYEDLNYEYIYQKPAYTSLNLMSDIGGQLGLWIGMSILTLGEYLELICRAIVTICTCKKKKSTVKPNTRVP